MPNGFSIRRKQFAGNFSTCVMGIVRGGKGGICLSIKFKCLINYSYEGYHKILFPVQVSGINTLHPLTIVLTQVINKVLKMVTGSKANPACQSK